MIFVTLSEKRGICETLLLFDNINRYIEDVIVGNKNLNDFKVTKVGIIKRIVNTILTHTVNLTGDVDTLYIALQFRKLHQDDYVIELGTLPNEDSSRLKELIQINVINEFDKGLLSPQGRIEMKEILNDISIQPSSINVLTDSCDLYKLTKGKKLIFKDSGEEIPFNRLSITYNNDEDKWYYTLVVNDQLLEINLTDDKGEIILC